MFGILVAAQTFTWSEDYRSRQLEAWGGIDTDSLFDWAKLKGNVNHRDAYGKTPLMHVIVDDIYPFPKITYLIDHGADLNAVDDFGWTALMYTMSSVHGTVDWEASDLIGLLVEKGGRIGKPRNEETLLWASFEGDEKKVDSLLTTPTAAGQKNYLDQNALFMSIATNRFAICEKLIRANVDLKAIALNAETALNEAIKLKRTNIAELLLDHGADPNLAPRGALSPLIIAICSKNTEITKLLIQKGADCNKDLQGRSPLGAFMSEMTDDDPNLALLEIILKTADVNYWPKHAVWTGGSPLGEAILRRKTKFALTLIKHHANVDTATAPFMMTPLMIATSQGLNEVAESLIKAGADIDKPDRFGNRAISFVKSDSMLAISKYLLGKGQYKYIAHSKPKKNHIGYLAGQFPWVTDSSFKYSSFFESMIFAHQLKTATLLLDNGAQVNESGCENDIHSPHEKMPCHSIFKAIKNRDKEVIDFFIENNIDLNIKNDRDETIRDLLKKYSVPH